MFEILHEISKVKSDSVRAFQKYDVSRYELINQITKERNLKYSIHRAIKTYTLISADLEQIQKLAKESPVTITSLDVNYQIIWKTPRGKVLAETDTNSEFFLSFREAKPEYKLPAYVLIWKKV